MGGKSGNGGIGEKAGRYPGTGYARREDASQQSESVMLAERPSGPAAQLDEATCLHILVYIS